MDRRLQPYGNSQARPNRNLATSRAAQTSAPFIPVQTPTASIATTQTATASPTLASSEAAPTSPPAPTAQVLTCPDHERLLYDFASAVDQALRAGDFDFILENFLLREEICSGTEQLGPCAGRSGTITGYQITFASSDHAPFLSEQELWRNLQLAAQVDPQASDEHGDSAWRLVGVLELEGGVLVTTAIGPNPFYPSPEVERQVYFFNVGFEDDRWMITALGTVLLSLSQSIDESPFTVMQPYPPSWIASWQPEATSPASRIHLGDCTWVSYYPGSPNRLRDQPGISAGKIVGTLAPDYPFSPPQEKLRIVFKSDPVTVPICSTLRRTEARSLCST